MRTLQWRLARGVVDGSIPGDPAAGEHERIARDLDQAATVLAAGQTRRFTNQCFFDQLRLDVQDEDVPTVTSGDRCERWASLHTRAKQPAPRIPSKTTNPDHDFSGRGSKMSALVYLARAYSNRCDLLERLQVALGKVETTVFVAGSPWVVI